jgi:CBS-domain-containing membrane protein
MKQWTVQDVMTADVASVLVDTPYAEVVAALANRKVSALPVLDGFHRVVGVVSEADLLHKVEFIGEDTDVRFFEWGTKKVNRAKANAATAGDLMTAPAVTVQPGVSLVIAAKRMEEEHIKRLPVLDEMGHLIGIISRRDLLKMYLRPDHDVRDDVIEGVLRQLLWIDPLTVQVEVEDGVVTLNGEVDRKSTAKIAAHVTKRVPGVVQVVDHVTWNYDDTTISTGVGA